MSDTSTPTSAFDIGSVFGLNGIGDIGTAFGLLRRSLSGEEITTEDIPEGMQTQILQMAMQQVGAESFDEFITNPTVMPQIIAGLRADTLERVKPDGTPHPPEDTIIFQYVNGLSGEELQELLVGNETLRNALLENDAIQEAIAAMVSEEATEAASTVTLQDVLAETGADLSGLPPALLSTAVASVSAEDLQNLDNSQLSTIIPALPQDVFEESVLSKLNEKLPEDQQVTSASASYEDQAAAFNQATEAVMNLADIGETNGFVDFFSRAATGIWMGGEQGVENDIFDTIREEIPEALGAFQENLPDLIVASARAEAASTEIDFAEMDPAEIRAFFEENSAVIAEQLTSEENWPLIETMITANNAALLRSNRDRIIEQMLPTMTEDGLNTFNSLMDSLPPQFRQIIEGFMDFFGGILQNFGINIGGSGPEPQQPPQQDPAPVDPNASAAPN